jgi:hypothetical protein
VSEATPINVTDLDTLEILLLKPSELGSGLNRPWNLWDYSRPCIRELNIALRLPLTFYKALEEEEALVSTAGPHASAVSST